MDRFLILLISMCWIPASLNAQTPLKIMSFNIRLNVGSDSANAWPNRLDIVESMLHYHNPDLLGVQEALEGQMQDLKKMLPAYQAHGVA
ncbi:MAG: endonuclease/exonuclease/phosphatase family protein, partial [Bacteroidota bacterium]